MTLQIFQTTENREAFHFYRILSSGLGDVALYNQTQWTIMTKRMLNILLDYFLFRSGDRV